MSDAGLVRVWRESEENIMALTKQELYRHAADNLDKGLPELDRVEMDDSDAGWTDISDSGVMDALISMSYGEKHRIRPKTKMVNGFKEVITASDGSKYEFTCKKLKEEE